MNEFNKSESYNKFLILAIAVNIPLPWIFIPYATQFMTAILFIFFIRQYVKANKISLRGKKGIIRLIIIIPSVIGILTQLFWIPYITQLYTVVLIGMQFVLAK